MTRCRLYLRASALVLAAVLVASCEEEPISSYFGTAPPESVSVEVKDPRQDHSCPAYYYYQFSADRKGDSNYCARILARCIGPNGRPREGCS